MRFSIRSSCNPKCPDQITCMLSCGKFTVGGSNAVTTFDKTGRYPGPKTDKDRNYSNNSDPAYNTLSTCSSGCCCILFHSVSLLSLCWFYTTHNIYSSG